MVVNARGRAGVRNPSSTVAAIAVQLSGSPAMTRLLTLVAAAALALASAHPLAQGAGKSRPPETTPAPPTTPAAPAKGQDTKHDKKHAATKPKGEPTKTRSGDPKGEAKGQTK